MADQLSEIKEILDVASPKTRDAIYILSTSSMLTDSIAQRLLVHAGVANGNAPEVVNELKSYPIWYMRTPKSWVLDDDVREYALIHLNGNIKQVQKSTLASLKELREEASNDLVFRDQKDLEYQIARLGLKINEEQEQAINIFRYFYETAEQFQVQETSRVVDLYIEEGIAFQDQAEGLPEYIQSAYFMRGKYAYSNRDFEKALRILSVVVNNISDSYQSTRDGAISYHLIGHIWAEDERKTEQAEKAYRQSLVLLEKINETFGRASVYHSLGNLFSKDRNRSKEAEEVYRQSLTLFKKDNKTFGLAQVYHSLGNLLSKDRSRAKEAEQAYRQSLALRERNDTVGLAQVYHSLGNLLRQDRNRAKEAEQAFHQSLEYLEKDDDTLGLAQVYHSLGNLLGMGRSRAKDAERALRQSLALFEKKNNAVGLAQVYHSLGNLLRQDRNRARDAEQAYRQSLALFGKANNTAGLAQVYHSLGNLFSKERNRAKDAEKAYKESLVLEQQNNNTFGLAQVYHSLGNLLSKDQKRAKEAEQTYYKSLNLRDPNDTFGLALVYHSLGNLLSKDRKRAIEAEQAFRQSLALEEKNNNAFGRAQVYHSLGNLLSKNPKRWDEAEQAYLQSLKFTAQRNHLAMVNDSYGKFEVRRGNNLKAMELLQESLKYETNSRYIQQTRDLLQEIAEKDRSKVDVKDNVGRSKQKTKFGILLEQYRNERKISQLALERQLSQSGYPITSGLVNRYEYGERNPSPDFIRMIAKVLKLNQEQIDALIEARFTDDALKFGTAYSPDSDEAS